MKGFTAIFPVLVLLLTFPLAYSGQGTTEGIRPNMSHRDSLPALDSGPGSEDVRIFLVDGKTGEAIADAEVLFQGGTHVSGGWIPNKLKPGWTKKWIRKTDRDGVVTLPTDILQQGVENLSTPGYVEQSIHHQPLVDQLVIELDPKEESKKGNYRLKFLDAKTKKRLSNRRVWVTRHPMANIWMHRTPDCLPSKCPEYWAGEETNRLGNIYYSSTLLIFGWIYMEEYGYVRFSPDWIKTGQLFFEKSD